VEAKEALLKSARGEYGRRRAGGGGRGAARARRRLAVEHLEGRLLLAGPTANDDRYAVVEDMALAVSASIGVLVNDVGTGLTAAQVSGPTHGAFALQPDGSFSYTPTAGFKGTDSFTYTAVDSALVASAPAMVTIAVDPAVAASPDSYAGAHDTALVVSAATGVLANDVNAFGLPLTATTLQGPAHGSLVLHADGSFQYVPNAHFSGSDSFVYEAGDGTHTSDPTFAFLHIAGAVTAQPDAYTAAQGTALTITAAQGVLANDTDSGGLALAASVVTQPTNGSVVVGGDGSFTYTPNPGWQGPDYFTYKASDGTFSATAAVRIKVNGPIAAIDDLYTTSAGTPLVVSASSGVLVNDSTTTGQSLTAVLVAPPLDGSLALAPDGSFTYTPAIGFSGSDGFSYAATDGALTSNSAFVTIRVASPIKTVADTGQALVNSPLVVPAATGVLANDTDSNPQGQPLTAALLASPAHGVVALHRDGSYTYTPDSGYLGSDVFTYIASDGGSFSSATAVRLEVASPVMSVADFYATPQGATLIVPTGSGVLANDSDVLGQPLSAAVVTPTAHGALALASDGSFSYTPAAGFIGTDSFVYQASDGKAVGAPTTVSIAVNGPITAKDDRYFTQRDRTLQVIAPLGVLRNVTDATPGHGTLTVTPTSLPAHGSLTLQADGSFTYAPAPGFEGVDSFAFTAADGVDVSLPSTVSITVQASIIANDDDYALLAGDPLAADAATGVLVNDSDGAPLTASLVSQAHAGTVVLHADGSFTYTPMPGVPPASDSFTYTATDGITTSRVATVAIDLVSPNEDDPIAAPDNYTALENQNFVVAAADGVIANDFDPQSEVFTAQLVSGPAHGALSLHADGSFTYTPDPAFNGIDQFSYMDVDTERVSAATTVTLTVRHVNQPPALDSISDVTVLENSGATTIGLGGILSGTPDEAGQAITLSAVSGDTTVVLKPTVVYASPSSAASLQVTPAANAFGSSTITVTVQDDGGTAHGGVDTVTRMFTVNVLHVNQAPSFLKGPDQSALDNAGPVAVPGWATSISPGPPNESSQTLTFLVGVDLPGLFSSGPAIAADGTLSFTPDSSMTGTATVTVRLMDNGGTANGGVDTSAPQTFTITVHDNPPVLQALAPTTLQGVVLENLKVGVFTDPDDQAATAFSATVDFGDGTAPVAGTVIRDSVESYHVVVSSHTYLAAGSPTLTVRLSDPGVGTITATATATVSPIFFSASGPMISNQNVVTFSGTAPSGFIVQFTGSGGSLPGGGELLGQTVVGAGNAFSLTTLPLADGRYTITARVLNSQGVLIGTFPVGSLLIDTTPPRIAGATLARKHGLLTLTFLENGSGMNPADVLNASNYNFVRMKYIGRFAGHVTGVAMTGPNQVTLQLNRGRYVTHGRYRLVVSSHGIADIAGNALDGEFAGSFPSGNGKAGGDFVSQVNVTRPGNMFLAYVGPHTQTSAVRHPDGPHQLARGRSRG
jgi:VCBS repeat-containing protein